jgi:hypothetical protein
MVVARSFEAVVPYVPVSAPKKPEVESVGGIIDQQPLELPIGGPVAEAIRCVRVQSLRVLDESYLHGLPLT